MAPFTSEKRTPSTSASTTTTAAATASAPTASNSAPNASAPPGNNSAPPPPSPSNGSASASARGGSATTAASKNPVSAPPNGYSSRRSKPERNTADGAAESPAADPAPAPHRPANHRRHPTPPKHARPGRAQSRCPRADQRRTRKRVELPNSPRSTRTTRSGLILSVPTPTLELALEHSWMDGWGGQDSNLCRQSQRVYSPSPLATRTPPRGH
jgi:hypothetical protein